MKIKIEIEIDRIDNLDEAIECFIDDIKDNYEVNRKNWENFGGGECIDREWNYKYIIVHNSN